MNDSSVLDLPKTSNTDSDDSEDFAHYVEAAKATEGYVMGTPVTALCGKTFIPYKDPLKLPICPICKSLAEALFLNHE